MLTATSKQQGFSYRVLTIIHPGDWAGVGETYFVSVGRDIPTKGFNFESRKENPQKPTQLSSRSHPRHLVGKRTAQKTPS